jgi:hypothetical protein
MIAVLIAPAGTEAAERRYRRRMATSCHGRILADTPYFERSNAAGFANNFSEHPEQPVLI